MAEVELFLSVTPCLVPALIQAAGQGAAAAHAADAAVLLEKMMAVAPGPVTEQQAASAVLLRAFSEGIACRQDSSDNTEHRVTVLARTLQHGLAAMGKKIGQCSRQRRQAEPQSPAQVHLTAGILVCDTAAALAAVMLQCVTAEALAFAHSRADKHAGSEQDLQ